MGAALSIFVILSISIFVVRIAAVALRITGLPENSARFQALSAFTGTGFTTSEAEMVVNYPIRRRLIGLLMIIGNMGLVTVLATLVVSLVRTDGDAGAVIAQVAWLLGGLALLWFLMLNSKADQFLCSIIGNILDSATFLGKRNFHRLVQIGDGYSICEHPVRPDSAGNSETPVISALSGLGLELLAIRRSGGELSVGAAVSSPIGAGDALIVFGPDAGHEALDPTLVQAADKSTFIQSQQND